MRYSTLLHREDINRHMIENWSVKLYMTKLDVLPYYLYRYIQTRSSESNGRSDVTDPFDLQLVLIALIGLYFPDCPDWFRLP